MELISKQYFNLFTGKPLTLILAHIQSEAIQAETTLNIGQSHRRCMNQYYELHRQVGTLLYIITSKNNIECLVKVKVGLSLLYINP